MLRLKDSEVRPGHRGEFRVLVAARRTGLGQVRAYLAADILRRLSERSRLAPTVADLRPDGEDELRAVCAELNIHPPRYTLTPPVAAGQLAGLFADGVREPVFDVGIRLAGAAEAGAGESAVASQAAAGGAAGEAAAGLAEPVLGGLAGYWIEVAGGADATFGGAGSPAGERLALGEEPLSVRMMLMRRGYGAALGGGGNLDGAAKTLALWRELVARWAQSPSGPMSRRYSDAVRAAFADDLDTATALRELGALADDPDVADGVKFETFAAADMLFGLDLARDIGR